MHMCRQVFTDDRESNELGLSKVVHIAKLDDLKHPPDHNKVPYHPRQPKVFEIEDNQMILIGGLFHLSSFRLQYNLRKDM
jgi:hypothetical protein